MATSRESGTLGTYQRYKLGQAQFQRWLKQTSDKFRRGGSAKRPTEPNGAKNPKYKYGSDHTAERYGLKGDSAATSTIHWSQLESMTRTVTDNLDPAQIPQSAISILRDVVHLRKKSALLFSIAAAKSNDDTLKKRNAAHEHIIQVLEKVLHQFDAALSHIRPSATQSLAHNDGQLGMNDINNMFEYLKLEESRDVEKDDLVQTSDTEVVIAKSPKKSHKKGAKKQKRKAQPKEQRIQKRTTGPDEASWVDSFQWTTEDEDEDEDEFDYYMLIYCFFQDFNSVRTYVCDRWTEYFYHKSVPLDTLAVVTNAACEMFHEMQHELERTLSDAPRLAQYDFMLEMLFFDYGLDHVDYSGEDELTERERNYKILEEADWLGFFAYSGANNLLKHIPPGKVPIAPTSAIKRPEYGLHELDGFSLFIRDVVTEIAPECCLVKAMKTNKLLPMIAMAQDQLTLDVEDIFRYRGYSSATIFSLSLYIDIRYIIEDQVIDAFSLLQTTAVRSKTILENQLPTIRGSWDIKRESRNRIEEIESQIIKDFVEEDKTRRLEETGIGEPFESHFLLKRDPIWSGLLDFRCRLLLADLGSRFINQSLVVAGTAFVYLASRPCNKPGLHWPQMDLLLKVHGKDGILQNALLKDSTPAGLLKIFVDYDLSVAHGSAASGLLTPSRSLEAFYRRYASENGRSRQSMAYLRDIIRDRSDAQAGKVIPKQATTRADKAGIYDGSLDAEEITMKSTYASLASVNAVEKGALWAARVSPVQLLEVMDETTTSLLENQLSIDYFLLHEESVRLLRELLVEFSQEIGKQVPNVFDENTGVDRLASLVPIIYRLMAEGDAIETAKRLVDAVSRFCSKIHIT
ncbi:hypothetical protein GGR54DRAFT_499787 [Hypoxylon sp. NC1633]|nr:hypothetical protein GGR54DRAFT_499787 [Hypoxylon sp. NC1633]